MKKLLFILSAIFVSATGWTQNPYAYGLSSKLSDDKQNLTINYSLNVKATSVQIEIIDENGNTCYTQQSAPIDKGANSITIPTASLPREKALNWKVIVNGGNTGTQPTVPVWAVSKRPNAVHGVAVNNDQQSANFGKIYAAESMMTNATNNKWTWLNGNVPALLEYNQDLSFKAFHKKSKQNGTAVSNFSTTEPNRVRVSADGRIFVASYHSNSSTAVWEYTGSGNYNTIIPRTAGSNLRPTSIDVKGSGKDLKLLVTYYDNKVDETNMIAKVYCYEYPIGTSTSKYTAAGTLKAQYNDYKTDPALPGLLYQAVKKGWYVYTVGLINAVYGDNDMIWMKIDFYVNTDIPSKVIAFNSSKTTPLKENDLPLSQNYYYGGDGIVVKGNLLVTGNNCAIHFYQTNTNGSFTKKYNDLSTIYNNTIYTNIWINDLAIDHANNLYVVSAYEGNMMVVALPNGGKTITNAAKQYAFTVSDPVPNILATDLTYAPYGNENKYEFSFNVNTKPELAQIRFYENEADMLACNNNYAFYYQFPDGDCKQGSMSVIFDAVGGTVENKLLNDPNENGLRNLPRGEYYWNVYVKTRKSCAFAPIYTQKLSDFNVDQGDYSGHSHRQHATVDNNPNNKGFGHIYVADHHNIADKNSRKHYVRAYTIGNATGNAQQDNQNNINDDTRYTTHWQVRNTTAHYTRRPAVAPDGMVYITDEGTNGGKVPEQITYGFNGAGMWVLDPNRQTDGDDVQWISPNFSTKTPNQEVVTALSFLLKGENWYIYKTNTYSEIEIHGPDNGGTGDLTSNVSWQKNGYRIYQLDKISGLLKHSGYNDAQTTTRAFGGGKSEYNCGDTNGQFSIIATKNGVWMCQHRMDRVSENNGEKNPDGKNSLMLSFFDHNGNRKYTSYEDKTLTQQTTSDFQASPGAGMAYQERNGVEYLYVVNHNGYILEFKITGGNNPQLTLTQKFPLGEGNKGKHGAVSSMNFDYAGNLVVTAGQTYGNTAYTQVGSKVQIERDHQDLVIYTMPYPNQENARAIPASEAFRFLPERVAHLDMGAAELDLIIQGHGGHGCAIDLYRPLQGAMFNTICLPFELNLGSLPADHPLKNAKLQAYTELKLETVGGEKMLELVFTDVNDNIIRANTPYIIRPENDEGINHIIRFDGPLVLTNTKGNAVQKTEAGGTYSITYQGIIPFQLVQPTFQDGESLTLMLVADNRLALMTSAGNMLGFRGYFQLNQPLPKGMQTRITTSKGTTTNTTIVVDGKKVNVEKYLQEGRVYIRMGDSLYTITGEKVE